MRRALVAEAGTPGSDGSSEAGSHAAPREDAGQGDAVERIHVDTSGFLGKLEEHGHRLVFTVDEHLFSLDLEVHRAAVQAPALARTKG